MTFSAKQAGVLRGIAAAAVLSVALLALAIWRNPFGFAPGLGVAQRLGVAANASMLVALCLAAAIARLARHRFFTPEDIDGSGLTTGSDTAKTLQALLQNTLEQAVLAALVYAAWAILLPSTWLSAVPLAAIAFALGRIAFFTRYPQGAGARAFGFGLTFYPSLGMLVLMLGSRFIPGR